MAVFSILIIGESIICVLAIKTQQKARNSPTEQFLDSNIGIALNGEDWISKREGGVKKDFLTWEFSYN